MPLTALICAAALQQQPADLTRREIGKSRLSIELPAALLLDDQKPDGPDKYSAYESFVSIDFKSGLTAAIIYFKLKDDIAMMTSSFKREQTEKIRGRSSDAAVSSRDLKVGTYDAVEVSGTFTEGGEKRGQTCLYIWGISEGWMVFVDHDASEAARAKQIINSARISNADWKRYRFADTGFLMDLPAPPTSQTPNLSTDHAETLARSISWTSNTDGLVEATVTYLKAKSGKAIGVDETIKAITDSIKAVAEIGQTNTTDMQVGDATGKQYSGSYKMGGAEKIFNVVILVRGNEGWDIRITGPGTLEAAQTASKIVDSIALEPLGETKTVRLGGAAGGGGGG